MLNQLEKTQLLTNAIYEVKYSGHYPDAEVLEDIVGSNRIEEAQQFMTERASLINDAADSLSTSMDEALGTLANKILNVKP